MSSNGHSRMEWVMGVNQDGEMSSISPEPRVGNLSVSSHYNVSNGELEDIAKKYCVENKHEFALYIDSGDGEVDPRTSEFRLVPNKAYKIFPDGKKEFVHNFIVVGNSYELLSQIMVTGGGYEVSHGTCGSTSGGVPTQNIAPSAFLPSVNIQAVDSLKFKKLLI